MGGGGVKRYPRQRCANIACFLGGVRLKEHYRRGWGDTGSGHSVAVAWTEVWGEGGGELMGIAGER